MSGSQSGRGPVNSRKKSHLQVTLYNEDSPVNLFDILISVKLHRNIYKTYEQIVVSFNVCLSDCDVWKISGLIITG